MLESGAVAPRTLGQLTGQMAHDLNNMLAVTLSTVEIASRMDDLTKVRGFLETALKMIDLQRAFTENMACASAGCESPTLIDVHELIAPLVKELQTNVEHQPALRFAAKRSLVQSDEAFLRDALTHVADLAREAMHGHGRLSIATRNSSADDASVTGGRDFIIIEIADSGAGMSEELRSKAFELFSGASRTELRLAQVRDTMRRAGGFASIESTPGAGTVVTLGLPIAS
ncbi:MAG TPA: HAMP domain-containing sensor histidine kinase [Rhodanobacteraceae bacterium]